MQDHNGRDQVRTALAELFSGYRAEWLADSVFSLFREPAYFPQLVTPHPCFLVGGRGTGKTTALRCLSYEGLSQLEGRRPDDVREWPYYGMYYRVNTNRVKAFCGTELPDDRWVQLFAHYINLEFCDLALRFLEWFSGHAPDCQRLSIEALSRVAIHKAHYVTLMGVRSTGRRKTMLDQLIRGPDPRLQRAVDQFGPTLEQLIRGPNPGLRKMLDQFGRTFEQLIRPDPGLQNALDQLGRPDPRRPKAIEQARIEASTLLADMPPLTPELFGGGAWNERVAEAVGRLEHVDALAEGDLADEADPDRAIQELAEDAATIQEAALPEAQERVNTRLFWLWVQRLADLAQLAGFFPAVFPVLIALLAVATPPEQALVPAAPELPTTHELEPVTTALTLPGDWAVEGLPAIVQRAGPAAAERMVEFFTAQIRNAHTRAAYAKAVTRFLTWCDERGLELYQISPVAVGIYVEELQGVYRAPTIKQHLAAIRRLFDWLVVGQVVSWNPAAAVRGPTHIVKRGKTPVLQPDEVRLLLDSIDTSSVGGLRDRALLGVMVYSFARVSAVVNMNVEDYYRQGKRWWLRRARRAARSTPCQCTTRGSSTSTTTWRPPGSGASGAQRCGVR